MPKRDPHAVLGVEPGATQAQVKAAWRRLAREHHPDLVSGDAEASRRATRQMARINEAYEALRRHRAGSAELGGPGEKRSSGPPRPRPERPVTGRVDTTATFRPRNTTIGPSARHRRPVAPRADRGAHEPLRASRPTGPMERGRVAGFRPAPLPRVEEAGAFTIEFGKFHGHTLGEIAAFEPSYIDWLARTISRDPDLVAAARSLQADMDRRGVRRRIRPEPERPGRS